MRGHDAGRNGCSFGLFNGQNDPINDDHKTQYLFETSPLQIIIDRAGLGRIKIKVSVFSVLGDLVCLVRENR